MKWSIVGVLAVFTAGLATARMIDPPTKVAAADAPLRLGKFSVCLAVKDLAASRAFYEKLGFKVFTGHEGKNWQVLQNETTTIALFQGFFPKNMLTFNPGWNWKDETLPDFDDVRAIQKTLKSRGLTLSQEADETTSGPASFMVTDPDGNPILVDQGVASPKK